jgi:pyruvate, water dikinase
LFSVPEGAFVIPFYFYAQHIANKNIAELINQLPNTNPTKIKAHLKLIRSAIKEQPISAQLLQSVLQTMQINNCGDAYRFRSSCNAEDIDNYNGAGLYQSKTGQINNPKKSFEKAIKEVWASMYSVKAYQERRTANLQEQTVMMAILAHRNFPDEHINGVAITKNLYRSDFPAYIINAQLGDVSTVTPPDSVQCEQLILSKNSTMNPFSTNYATKYIQFSSLHPHQSIFSKAQITQLAKSISAIEQFYESQHKHWDIEFKFHNNQLYYKQVRPYH